ncbi:MAG: diadenylate cyclase CdaA [Pseudomonadota bacterium]
MPESKEVLDFIRAMRWQDWADIFFVAVIIYQALRLIRGTRSMQMLVGLAFVLGAYEFSAKFDLLTLNWILSNFLTYIILILVILFQSDIRRALTQVAKISFGRTSPELLSAIGEVVRAAFTMAEKRIGALIVFEREVGLKNYIDIGAGIDGKVSDDLLLSIFNTASPLHDGAVVIQDGRIAAAACFLPLSSDDTINRLFGTRHRAAIGLTRETDSAVVVVSEERGVVSLVLDGDVTVILDQNELRDKLAGLLKLTGPVRVENDNQET